MDWPDMQALVVMFSEDSRWAIRNQTAPILRPAELAPFIRNAASGRSYRPEEIDRGGPVDHAGLGMTPMKRLVATTQYAGTAGLPVLGGLHPAQILYSRDGIIYVVPFLLFFFCVLVAVSRAIERTGRSAGSGSGSEPDEALARARFKERCCHGKRR